MKRSILTQRCEAQAREYTETFFKLRDNGVTTEERTAVEVFATAIEQQVRRELARAKRAAAHERKAAAKRDAERSLAEAEAVSGRQSRHILDARAVLCRAIDSDDICADVEVIAARVAERLADVGADAAAYRKALSFYADEASYRNFMPEHPGHRFSRPIEYDTPEKERGAIEFAGERARRILTATDAGAALLARLAEAEAAAVDFQKLHESGELAARRERSRADDMRDERDALLAAHRAEVERLRDAEQARLDLNVSAVAQQRDVAIAQLAERTAERNELERQLRAFNERQVLTWPGHVEEVARMVEGDDDG